MSTRNRSGDVNEMQLEWQALLLPYRAKGRKTLVLKSFKAQQTQMKVCPVPLIASVLIKMLFMKHVDAREQLRRGKKWQ